MKKARIPLLFLVILAAIFLTACDGTYALGDTAPEPPEIVFTDGMPIHVTLATDELLSGFADYLDLSTLEEGDIRLLFASNMRLMNFRVIEVGYDDGFYVSREVIVQKELFPDRPIVAMWIEPETAAYRGISFVCEDFETRYFILEFNREEAGGEPFTLREF